MPGWLPNPAVSTTATLWAPPGQAVQLQFSALWLPPTATLTIYEGTSSSGRPIVSLSGTELSTQAIIGRTGVAMYMELHAPAPACELEHLFLSSFWIKHDELCI